MLFLIFYTCLTYNFNGDDMLVIEESTARIINYIKLKKIENNVIVIAMKNLTYEIEGENLTIAFYDRNEIKIKGKIKGIKIIYE